jgi:outer membrane protein assembly factor BamB
LRIAHFICPSYEIDEETLSLWTPFLGDYEVWQRHYSAYTVNEIPDNVTLKVENDVLTLIWYNNFILEPISQTELIILGVPFDGELMQLDPVTGEIYWQNRVFKPINE